MTGQALYDLYRAALARGGCDSDEFDELEGDDQNAWHHLAAHVQLIQSDQPCEE